MKKFISALLVAVMLLSSASLGLLADLDLFGTKASALDYQVGDIIEFGSYPQAEVKDSTILSALNSQPLDWISYGYFSGEGSVDGYGSMVQGDWMKYADVAYDGNKYRAVEFTQYRPRWTKNTPSNTIQDDNGYYTNTVYWFKYEPIKWQVLDPAKGLILSETCIDAQAYCNTIYTNYDLDYYYYNDITHTHYASDYVTSSIRRWLNEDFYNIAFNSEQQSKIVETKLDNSSPLSSKYNSESTTDKVFLMSHSEMKNTAYGYSTKHDPCVAREAKSTDYAKAQGCYQSKSSGNQGNAEWFLRPAGDSGQACAVGDDGNVAGIYDVYCTSFGIRPALCLNTSALSAGANLNEGTVEDEKASKNNSEKSNNNTILYGVISVLAVIIIVLAVLLIKKTKVPKKPTNCGGRTNE